jgi:hypothetical protein
MSNEKYGKCPKTGRNFEQGEAAQVSTYSTRSRTGDATLWQ